MGLGLNFHPMVSQLPNVWRHCTVGIITLEMDLEASQTPLTGLYRILLMRIVYSVQGTLIH